MLLVFFAYVGPEGTFTLKCKVVVATCRFQFTVSTCRLIGHLVGLGLPSRLAEQLVVSLALVLRPW